MNHQFMSQLAGDPARVRRLAVDLINDEHASLSAEARMFLESLLSYIGNPVLTGSQQEWLSDLMKPKTRTRTTRDGRGPDILNQAFAQHAEIPDCDDEQALISLYDRWQLAGLTTNQWERVLQVARQLGLLGKGDWVQV
jgi:hypothetical protein